MSHRVITPSPIAAAGLQRAVYAVLRRNGARRPDIEDLAQETLARVLAVAEREAGPLSWTALAVVIARNVAVDHRRRRDVRARCEARFTEVDEVADVDDGERAANDALDRRRQLALFMRLVGRRRLPPHAVALVLAANDGAKAAEVARELGLGQQAVRNELHRTRRVFREAWRRLERGGRGKEEREERVSTDSTEGRLETVRGEVPAVPK